MPIPSCPVLPAGLPLTPLAPSSLGEAVASGWNALNARAQHRHGLVLGKFMPPHEGHRMLWTMALASCERLTILVEQRPDEPVPAALRRDWVATMMGHDPRVTVKVLPGDHPQDPSEMASPAVFMACWRDLLRAHAGADVDALIASDDYGRPLAAALGVPWIPVSRAVIPTSGTAVRACPWAEWRWLPEVARVAWARRLVILGPESTGKSTLTARLAARHSTVGVPEYAQQWIDRLQRRDLTAPDFDWILAGQARSRAAWAPQANRFLVEDSNALTTALWEAWTLGEARASTWAWAQADRPDHVLLLSAEGAPWVDAHHRYVPEQRQAFFEDFKARLDAWGWSYEIVHGDGWAARNAAVDQAVDRTLARWAAQPLAGLLADRA